MTRVTVFLMGGLGNQLFQIFTAMGYSLRNGYEFMFQDCKELSIGTVRPTYWENLLSTLKPFLVSKHLLDSFPRYSESGFTFSPLSPMNNDVMLYGYFQSLKYFQEELPVILDILNIPAQISKMRERFPDTRRQASMHFRITGYREFPRFHPVAPYEYYRWAVSQISLTEILYFNQPEDTEEVEEMVIRLQKEFPGIRFISAGQELQDWEQMLLMSCTKTHIIANSTFSWWGAMLNGTSEVYYPCNWFGPDAGHSINDLVLPSWHGFS